jgi:transforming growth factor-beta-induced protein
MWKIIVHLSNNHTRLHTLGYKGGFTPETMRKSIVYTFVACLLIAAMPYSVTADVSDDIPANAASTGVHDTLVAALTHAGLVATLQGDGPFTVFAPTDQAFADAGINLSTFDTPEENETLADILLYHVYSGYVSSSEVTDGLSVVMANGDKASFTVTNDSVMIGGATVTSADVPASNGMIHVIDKVLMPPPGEICYNVVSHTIVPGATNLICNSYMFVENYTMGGQNITGCYNTVTHQVSNISAAQCGAFMWTPAVNIAMTAQATTIHTALVAALAAADLVTTLSGDTEYTVFAPSDDAFAAAGIDLDTFDTDEEIAILADILLYHVVAGTTLSTDLAAGANTVTAANGDELTITVSDTGVAVGADGAVVTLADVPASNGVIHVIDKVLTPPADDPFAGVDCAATIGLSPDGYGFTPSSVTIEVGQTVCWSWTDSAMAHNVKQVDGFQSSTYVDGGVTSGAPATTVAFHHTFTENTTFYYACEPHVSMKMHGEIIVGDGGVEPTSDKKESEDAPGFIISSMVVAVLGAVLFMSRRRSL